MQPHVSRALCPLCTGLLRHVHASRQRDIDGNQEDEKRPISIGLEHGYTYAQTTASEASDPDTATILTDRSRQSGQILVWKRPAFIPTCWPATAAFVQHSICRCRAQVSRVVRIFGDAHLSYLTTATSAGSSTIIHCCCQRCQGRNEPDSWRCSRVRANSVR
jgi:hypothetical protein